MLDMEEIAATEFKASCLAVLQRVRKTRQPIRITRFGKPVAEIVPPSVAPAQGAWIGSMAGTAVETGDIVAPAADSSEWSALSKRGRR
jgi:prevent-host-death family protein